MDRATGRSCAAKAFVGGAVWAGRQTGAVTHTLEGYKTDKRPSFGTVVVLEIETVKRHLKPIRNGREG